MVPPKGMSAGVWEDQGTNVSTNRTIFIGIGSNIGDRVGHCIESINRVLSDGRVRLLAVSSLYLTSPVSEVPQDDFINGVIAVEWTETPADLLSFLNGIENDMGRVRPVPMGPRIVDLDIILFGDVVLSTTELIIPHRELHRRKFVLVPCLEIDPFLVHPSYGEPLSSFLGNAEETQAITLHLPSSRVDELLRKGEDPRGRAN